MQVRKFEKERKRAGNSDLHKTQDALRFVTVAAKAAAQPGPLTVTLPQSSACAWARAWKFSNHSSLDNPLAILS